MLHRILGALAMLVVAALAEGIRTPADTLPVAAASDSLRAAAPTDSSRRSAPPAADTAVHKPKSIPPRLLSFKEQFLFAMVFMCYIAAMLALNNNINP
jgi:hypothetical protein